MHSIHDDFFRLNRKRTTILLHRMINLFVHHIDDHNLADYQREDLYQWITNVGEFGWNVLHRQVAQFEGLARRFQFRSLFNEKTQIGIKAGQPNDPFPCSSVESIHIVTDLLARRDLSFDHLRSMMVDRNLGLLGSMYRVNVPRQRRPRALANKHTSRRPVDPQSNWARMQANSDRRQTELEAMARGTVPMPPPPDAKNLLARAKHRREIEDIERVKSKLGLA
jgi:hypothetical protein